MITNAKEATAKALEAFKEFYPSQFGNLMLEEVERDNEYWYITLGYDLPATGLGLAGVLAQASGKGPRGYKVFKIDRATGEVVSMKIREAAAIG